MGGAPYKSVKEKDGRSFDCFRIRKRRPPMSSLQLLDAFEGETITYNGTTGGFNVKAWPCTQLSLCHRNDSVGGFSDPRLLYRRTQWLPCNLAERACVNDHRGTEAHQPPSWSQGRSFVSWRHDANPTVYGMAVLTMDGLALHLPIICCCCLRKMCYQMFSVRLVALRSSSLLIYGGSFPNCISAD